MYIIGKTMYINRLLYSLIKLHTLREQVTTGWSRHENITLDKNRHNSQKLFNLSLYLYIE